MRVKAILAVAVAILGMIGWLLWQLWAQGRELSASEAARFQIESERDELRQANRANSEALALLADMKALDDAQLVALAMQLEQITATLSKTASERKQLAEKNPDVKTFLSTPIPDALRVQNNTP